MQIFVISDSVADKKEQAQFLTPKTLYFFPDAVDKPLALRSTATPSEDFWRQIYRADAPAQTAICSRRYFLFTIYHNSETPQSP